MKRLFSHLIFLLIIVSAIPDHLMAQESSVSKSLMQVVRSGSLDELTDGVATGVFTSETESRLARALLQTNGLTAADEFSRIANSGNTPEELRTLAWFHLYGYARLIDDRTQVNRALEGVKAAPELAAQLFKNGIPSPMSPKAEEPPPSVTGRYAVQIGAFGSQQNAQRLADQQARKGYTVVVEPLRSGNRTLFAVWVGQFNSESEAASFGRRTYGKEGKDFRVVHK